MAKKISEKRKIAKAKAGTKSGLTKSAVKPVKKVDLDYSTAEIAPNDKMGDRFISFTAEDKHTGKRLQCFELRSEMDQDLLKELEAQEADL